MKKLTILLFAFFFITTSCKYEPIYSQKKIGFVITKIQLGTKNSINLKIKDNLKIYTKEDDSKNLELKIKSQKNIKTILKNSKGNPEKFEMHIEIDLTISKKNNYKKEISFKESFKYNNSSRKFELNQLESTIEDDLINQIYNEILIYLSSN
mgnify:CR=1 FL=1